MHALTDVIALKIAEGNTQKHYELGIHCEEIFLGVPKCVSYLVLPYTHFMW